MSMLHNSSQKGGVSIADNVVVLVSVKDTKVMGAIARHDAYPTTSQHRPGRWVMLCRAVLLCCRI